MISKCRYGTRLRVMMAILVITCLCFQHVKGSCLSYGHSCWGAHGKRGGPPKRAVSNDAPASLVFRGLPAPDQTNNLPSILTAADRWALVRVLPNKNPYYPFGKVMHPSPPLAAAPFYFTDDTDAIETDSLQEASTKLAARSAEAGNDSNKQSLTSPELGLVLGDERQLLTSSRPAATRRRDHGRSKKPSMATRTPYATVDASYDDNPTADRLMASTDEEIGQMLLLDAAAAAAAAVPSDSDGSTGSFTRKLLSTSSKYGAPMSA